MRITMKKWISAAAAVLLSLAVGVGTPAALDAVSGGTASSAPSGGAAVSTAPSAVSTAPSAATAGESTPGSLSQTGEAEAGGQSSQSGSGSQSSQNSVGSQTGQNSVQGGGQSSAGQTGGTTRPGTTTTRPGTTTTRPHSTARPSGTTTATTAGTTATRPTNAAPTATPAGKMVVGYYGGWASYKGYTPAQIPASRLTHLHYAFAKIEKGKVVLADPANDRKNLAAIRALKKKHRHLKAMISVGGWDYSGNFSDAAATAAARETFADSAVAFIVEHGLDGVDLDWEYPVSGGKAGNGNRPADKQNFTLLLQTLRRRLDEQGRRDGRQYYLSIAGAANTSYLSKIEPAKVAGTVDYIFVMAYDMHGPWDKYADLNAPLYRPGESSPQYKNSVSDAVSAWRNAGAAASRLVLGMPFYGYVYQGVSAQNNGLYSAFTSAKSISYDALRSGYLSGSAYTRLRHAAAQVPYLYGGGVFVSYEDEASIAAKAAFARAQGLGGVGAWELSHDTSGALLASAYKTLYK